MDNISDCCSGDNSNLLNSLCIILNTPFFTAQSNYLAEDQILNMYLNL